MLIRLLKSANKKTMSLNRAVHLLFFVSAIIIHHSIHFHHSKSTSVTPWWWEKYEFGLVLFFGVLEWTLVSVSPPVTVSKEVGFPFFYRSHLSFF